MSTYSGVLTAPTVTGDQQYTGFGFQPKAVILTCTYQTTANSDSTTAYFCQSFITSATQKSLSHASEHGLSSNQDVIGVWKDTALYLVNDDETILMEASLVSLDSDGITLNFTTTSANIKIGCWAVGGSGITNAFIKELSPKGSTGTQAYTGVGFTGNLAFSMGTGSTAASGVTATSSWTSFGAVDGALSQASSCGSSATGSVSNAGIWYNDSFYLQGTAGSLSATQRASFSSFDADGFTLDWLTSGTTNGKVWVLVLLVDGGNTKVGVVTDRTTTGTTSITSTSFTPNAALFFNSVAQDSATGQLAHYTMLGFCGSSVGNACVFAQNSWGLKTSVASRVHNTNKIIRTSVVGTVQWEASLQSYESNGCVLNYSTATSGAKNRAYVLLNVTSTAPAAAPRNGLLLGVGV